MKSLMEDKYEKLEFLSQIIDKWLRIKLNKWEFLLLFNAFIKKSPISKKLYYKMKMKV